MATLLEIIDKTFNKPLNHKLLKELRKLGYVEDTNEIKTHELLEKFFTNKKVKSPDVKRDGVIENDKCLARIWGNGECRHIQCSFNKVGGDFCDKHNHKFNQFGFWYLNKVTEKEPECPIHPGNGRDTDDPMYVPPHDIKWLCDVNGIKIIETPIMITHKKEEKTKDKKKRGRPPGSKNKKKVVEKEEDKLNIDFKDDYMIDGVPYDLINDEIWDTNRTGELLGHIIEGKIVWGNEKIHQLHKNNL
tara:strand:+ start:115 stop:852 length:738 start_codon:yes stop_codon:yes gene_type:complete